MGQEWGVGRSVFNLIEGLKGKGMIQEIGRTDEGVDNSITEEEYRISSSWVVGRGGLRWFGSDFGRRVGYRCGVLVFGVYVLGGR